MDNGVLPEASGIAASRRFPNRLYHVNDSGNGPFFLVSDLRGRHLRKVRLEGFDAEGSDFEDLTVGPCGSGGSCLFIGDIGDNSAKRSTVRIVVLEERERFAEAARPLRIIEIRYADGPRDAEGLAAHPNGDLYVLSKEADYLRRQPGPAHLYRIARETLEAAGTGQPVTSTPVASFDIEKLAANPDFWGRLPTGLAIAPDGLRFLVLTPAAAYEFDKDLSRMLSDQPVALEQNAAVRAIPIRRLPQPEAITYLPDGSGFLYDTENDGEPVELLEVRCLE